MKNSYLALICGVLLFIVLSMAWCKPQPKSQPGATPPPSVSPSMSTSSTAPPVLSPTAAATPSASVSAIQLGELRKAADKIAPAVILVSVFDASGKPLRTGTGFFISDDGKFVTNLNLVEGGVNAIANTADKKIHNVTGVLMESPELDLAVLKADAKQVPFLPLTKAAAPVAGERVAIVGSPLSHRADTNLEARVAAPRSEEKREWLELSTPIPNDANGSPVVNESGEVVGVLTLDRAKNPATIGVLSSGMLQSFLARVEPNATPRWAEASPSPTKPPKRKGKIVFNPAPSYPPEAYNAAIKGTGHFRIVFDTDGHAKNVQIVSSTGAAVLDRAAMTAFQQWKSDPGPEWSIVVPVSFQPKAPNQN
jgi:TonB family protein